MSCMRARLQIFCCSYIVLIFKEKFQSAKIGIAKENYTYHVELQYL